jgi:hypothetical protein
MVHLWGEKTGRYGPFSHQDRHILTWLEVTNSGTSSTLHLDGLWSRVTLWVTAMRLSMSLEENTGSDRGGLCLQILMVLAYNVLLLLFCCTGDWTQGLLWKCSTTWVFFILFICAYNAWVISPPFPHPSFTLPAPSLSPQHPPYREETILPLSPILLKRV